MSYRDTLKLIRKRNAQGADSLTPIRIGINVNLSMKNKLPYYELDGKRYDSVTAALSVISKGLEEWYGRVGLKEANKIKNEATGIGDRFHGLVKDETQLGKPPKWLKKDSSALRNAWEAYLAWKQERGVPSHAVVDFKTSKRICPTYWLQLKAYQNAFEESVENTEEGDNQDWWKGVLPEQFVVSRLFEYAGTSDLICCDPNRPISEMQLIIVRLDKDLGNYEQVVYDGEDNLLETFLGTLKIYRYMKDAKGKNEPEKN